MAAGTPAPGSTDLPAPPFDLDKHRHFQSGGTDYDPYMHPESIPAALVAQMAQYLREIETQYAQVGDKGQVGSAYFNINHTAVRKVLDGTASKHDLAAVAEDYAKIAKPLPSIGSIPGSGTAQNAINAVEDVWGWVKDPKRIAMIVVGVVLIGVGANSIIKSGTGKSPARTALRLSPFGRAAGKSVRSAKFRE